MSIIRLLEERRRKDAELERDLRLQKNDPTRERYGGILYSPADIKKLEEEKVPWLRRKRQAS